MISSRAKLLLCLLAIASLLPTVLGESLLSSLSLALCGIVRGIQVFVGILALALFMIGGTMYAVAHFIPTSVDFRKSLQGWSSAMVIGGVIGLVVVIIAPALVNLFAGFSTAVGGSAITAGCSGGAASSSTGTGGSGGTGSTASCSGSCQGSCPAGQIASCTWTCTLSSGPGAACGNAGACTTGTPSGLTITGTCTNGAPCTRLSCAT